jgi:hypothetical protein
LNLKAASAFYWFPFSALAEYPLKGGCSQANQENPAITLRGLKLCVTAHTQVLLDGALRAGRKCVPFSSD